MKIGIIGGGIIGLNTGVVLAEAGYDVQIYSKHQFEEITSYAAAATGYPTNIEDSARVNEWFIANNKILEPLVDEKETGVSRKTWTRLSVNEKPEIPSWWPYVVDPQILGVDSCPQGFLSGIRGGIVHMHVGLYFPYMLRRFQEAGGRYDYREIEAMDNISCDFDCLINSTGIFAHHFVGDESVQPGRGQVVVVRNPGLEDCLIVENTMNYIYPRGDECILGGSFDKGDWSMQPDEALTARILDNAAALEPRLRDPEILSVRVGLRPLRSTVRLEKDILPDGTMLIHNYGHGGAGYTVSWGCAQDVLKLVQSA